MKRIALLLVVLLLVPIIALAESAADLVPDTSLWGVSRTKFRNTYDETFTDVTIGDYKGLLYQGLEVDGYALDAYFEFSSKESNYNGLSKVVYLLPVQQKVSDANLTKCYNALLNDLLDVAGTPATSTKTRAFWSFEDCTLELNIGKYTDYNQSSNKTVAVIFAMPEAQAAATQAPSAGKSTGGKKMTVTATATCSDYNHVGSDWSQVFYINGKKVAESSEITLSVGDQITVKAKITENDGTPDVGEGEKSYTVTRDDLNNGFTVSFNVTVTEDKGRYSGNKARWSVRFKFA